MAGQELSVGECLLSAGLRPMAQPVDLRTEAHMERTDAGS